MSRPRVGLAVHVLGIALLFNGCSDESTRGTPPTSTYPFRFANASIVLDETAEDVFIPIARAEPGSGACTGAWFLAPAPTSSDLRYADRRVCFRADATLSALRVAVTRDSIDEAPETYWLTLDSLAMSPITDDSRFLRLELLDRRPSASLPSEHFGLGPGMRWPMRIMGLSTDGPTSRDLWGELVEFQLGAAQARDGVDYYPLTCSRSLTGIALSLGEDHGRLLATIPTDPGTSRFPEEPVLRARLARTLPWILADRSDQPGTLRTLAQVDTVLLFGEDSSKVRYSSEVEMLGRFDLAGPAGVFEGTWLVRVRESELIEAWSALRYFSSSGELTLALNPEFGLVRVRVRGHSNVYDYGHSYGSWSDQYTGNLEAGADPPAPRTRPTSSPTRP